MATGGEIDVVTLVLRHRMIRAQQQGLRQVNVSLTDLKVVLDALGATAKSNADRLNDLEARLEQLERLHDAAEAGRP